MKEKRGQIGTEYLIIVSFIVFIILSTLGLGLYYSNTIQNSIKINQLDRAVKKIVYSAETTFYDGEGTLSTVTVYFPSGIQNVTIYPEEILFQIETSSGVNIIGYGSKVPLNGTLPMDIEGTRRIRIQAYPQYAQITFQ